MFVGIFDCIFHCVLAETSVTIDDIVYVIDTGKVKMTNFDVKANIATFKPEWISLANSKPQGRVDFETDLGLEFWFIFQ